MRENLFVRLVLLASVLAVPGRAAAPPSVDECIKNLRTGPDSFVAYLCLGTPGMPEQPAAVAATLDEVLRQKPGEPHARIYRALMRMYRLENPSKLDFEEPVAEFRRRGEPVDLFLAQLGLLEFRCDRIEAECRGAEPLLIESEALARRIGDPSLLRLAAIARLRWCVWSLTCSAGQEAERALDALPPHPPTWLALLEATSRARFGIRTANSARARELYSRVLDVTPPDSVAHAAALGGYAGATARAAWQGLVERSEAEQRLRQALDAQERLGIEDYSPGDIGSKTTRRLLALLLGPTPEGRALADLRTPHPLAVEFLLQGSSEDRKRALDLARALTDGPPDWTVMLSRSHAELAVGSHLDGVTWGKKAIERSETWRDREMDVELRMGGDWLYDTAYKTFADDLLRGAGREDPDVALAFRVTEELRARLLLNSLLTRAGRGTKEAIPDVREFQSALKEDEALVSFMVSAPQPTTWIPYTRAGSWAFVLTRTDLRVVPIPPGTALEPAVRAWTGLLDARQDTAARGARHLHAELLQPVLAGLPAGVRSLVLVPDGALHRLAFDALSETGGPPYVADRYSLAVVPSATIWLRLRQRSPMPPGVALAFANTPEGPAVPVAERRGEVESGQLPALLHAWDEAKEAVDAFPRGSKVFAGAEASPEMLSGAVFAHASLVHFASHGVVNAREPNESFLLLAPGAHASGRLKVSDVQQFDWTGKTVVLSACDTSIGAVRLGEGVLSLARGFFAGGASSVLGTIAQVRDDEQQALFHQFYAELRHGVSVGEARTAAKRALVRSGAPPAAWANVIVLGVATVRPRAADSFWGSQAFLSGSAAGLVLLVLGLRTRRRKTGASSE